MKQYIDKATVVAEIERLITELIEEGEDTMFEQGRISALEDVKMFINHTLEVKEEPVSEGTMTIRKEWFEHCKKSWYNEGYIDGKYNCDMQFEELDLKHRKENKL